MPPRFRRILDQSEQRVGALITQKARAENALSWLSEKVGNSDLCGVALVVETKQGKLATRVFGTMDRGMLVFGLERLKRIALDEDDE